jgi:hypothetical protein
MHLALTLITAFFVFSGLADAAGGAERRQALPDGDRERALPRQGISDKCMPWIDHRCRSQS